jgi:hypothetical protein
MNASACSYIHFFDTLRDIVTSKPYAMLSSEEVNSLINQIDSLANAANTQVGAYEHARSFRRAINNAKGDGYFPIVILPGWKYEVVMAFLKSVS